MSQSLCQCCKNSGFPNLDEKIGGYLFRRTAVNEYRTEMKELAKNLYEYDQMYLCVFRDPDPKITDKVKEYKFNPYRRNMPCMDAVENKGQACRRCIRSARAQELSWIDTDFDGDDRIQFPCLYMDAIYQHAGLDVSYHGWLKPEFQPELNQRCFRVSQPNQLCSDCFNRIRRICGHEDYFHILSQQGDAILLQRYQLNRKTVKLKYVAEPLLPDEWPRTTGEILFGNANRASTTGND